MSNLIKVICCGGLLAMLLTACNNKTSDNPNTVLEEFFEHLAKKDLDGAARYVTSDSKATLQMMKKGLQAAEKIKDSLPDTDFLKEFEDVIFEPAKITGNSALITVNSKTQKRPSAEFKLVKENSGWKVDFTMSTLMKMGMSAATQAGSGIGDSIKAKSGEVQKGLELADSAIRNINPDILDEVQKKLENLK